MSIDALTKTRLRGYKPRLVWVLVGNVPRWVEDGPNTVIVRKKETLDFRALIGLDVSVIEVETSPLMNDVLDAMEKANAKSISICGAAGTVGMGVRPMEKMRELLCNS